MLGCLIRKVSKGLVKSNSAIGSDKDEYVGWARASGQGESSKMRPLLYIWEAKELNSKKSRTSIKKEDERARIEFANSSHTDSSSKAW